MSLLQTVHGFIGKPSDCVGGCTVVNHTPRSGEFPLMISDVESHCSAHTGYISTAMPLLNQVTVGVGSPDAQQCRTRFMLDPSELFT